MLLSSFNITNFRNFNETQLNFDDNCNIFYGKNGAGKTSILEAIYYLVLGRSFRSHILRRIVKNGSDEFSLFGKTYQNDTLVPLGLTRSIKNGKRLKVAGKEVSSNTELTKLIPLQLLNHDCYMMLYDGPKPRRQFMDWGLFHVEQSFLGTWQKVERALKQRNVAIRTKSPTSYIKAWDKDLAQYGTKLHEHRKKYVEALIPIAQNILKKLLCDFTIDISYNAGWNLEFDLETALANSLKNDLRFGYTTVGPQRADLQLLVGKSPAKDALSRGQQKVLLYGLKIAQGVLLNQLTGKKCVYLVDDLLAELDSQKYTALTNALLELEQSQLFITGLYQDYKDTLNTHSCSKKIFQIEDGLINSD